jgi:GH24 family phage-related lysozyme (muramidase)
MNAAEQLVAKHEGFRRQVYTDTRNKPTIGYGFNLGDPTAIATCDAHGLNISDLLNGIMADQVLEARFAATKIFRNFDTLPEKVQMVVIDMLFEMGETVFREFHATIAAIKAGKFDVAADCMRQSKWYGEVPARAIEDCSLMEDAAIGIAG